MRRRWLFTEVVLLCITATQVFSQAQTTTPDQTVNPFGLSAPTLLAIVLGGGGAAAIGKSVLDIIRSISAGAVTWSKDYPKRLESDRKREEVETQDLTEQVKFTRIINEALAGSREEINSMRRDMLAMQGNSTQQALLITKMQQAQLDQETAHKEQMTELDQKYQVQIDALNRKSTDMEDKLEGKEKDVEIALESARDWKLKYEAEAARADAAEARAAELQRRLARYETGEIPPVAEQAVGDDSHQEKSELSSLSVHELSSKD